MKTFFSHARVALKFGLLDAGCSKGDFILAPSYICDVALTPFRDLGLKIKFYSLKKDFTPIWEEIEKHVKEEEFFAILMVHYFGFPQNIMKFKEFSNRNDMLLIEDNAHGYGGFYEGRLLGTFGHFGISSPRKTLNTPSGAILYKGNIILEPNLLERKTIWLGEPLVRKLFSLFPKLKIWFLRLSRNTPDIFDPSLSEEREAEELIADRYSEKILNNSISLEALYDIREQQQERWSRCSSLMKELNITPLYEEIDKEVSPWLFPIIADSIYERKKIYGLSVKRGFIVSAWPTLPPEVIEERSDGYSNWHSLLFVHLNFRI